MFPGLSGILLEEGINLLADLCPNFKIHKAGKLWCLHPDEAESGSYHNEDLLTCVISVIRECTEKAEQAKLN